MNCDPLLGKALGEISMRHRFPAAMGKIFNDAREMKASHVLSTLQNKGVTDRELKSLELYSYLKSKGDERVSAFDVYRNMGDTIGTQDLGKNYADFTYDKSGIDNSSYKETGFITKGGNKDLYKPHYDWLDSHENLIGWNRTSAESFEGRNVLMLHEFQSDWAQTERAGRGVFKKNVGKPAGGVIDGSDVHAAANRYYLENGYKKTDAWKKNFKKKVLVYDENTDRIGVNATELREAVSKDEFDLILKDYNPKETADFDMGDKQFNQLMIVDALDQAMKKGLDTVMIPINRSGDLAGTEGVTKFYNQLDKTILPGIRKKLAKEGMKIETRRVKNSPTSTLGYQDKVTDDDWDFVMDAIDFNGDVSYFDGARMDDILEIDAYIRANFGQKYTFQHRAGEKPNYGTLVSDDVDAVYAALERAGKDVEALVDYSGARWSDENYSLAKLDEFVEKEYGPQYTMLNQYAGLISNEMTPSIKPQEFHEIKIVHVDPDKPVNWDIYGVLGALGLAEEYERLNTDEQ